MRPLFLITALLILVAACLPTPAAQPTAPPTNPPPTRPPDRLPVDNQGPYFHQIFSANSPDGLVWSHDDRLLLDHASVPTAIVTPEGRIRLYYVDASQTPENVNCAESADGGQTFQVLNCTIANRAGDKAVDPSIVRLPDGRYRLYYYAVSGQLDKARPHAIYSAISDDGVRFTQEGKAFEHPGLVDPDVFWTGQDWLMYVFSLQEQTTVIARSQDGLSFEYEGPLHLKGWGTTAPVRLDDGRFRLYAFDQRTAQTVGSFTSTDGLTWTQEPGTRLTARPGTRITDPFVVRLPDGAWKMFFKVERGGSAPGATPQPPPPSPTPAAALAPDLVFVPDAGFRVANAVLPAPSVDSSGVVYLFYEEPGPPGQPGTRMVATSADGLTFANARRPTSQDLTHHPFTVRLPDGTWRRYLCDQQAAVMKSESSTDGVSFRLDAGVRYQAQPGDHGTIGVYDVYVDPAGGVVLLYVGDMYGVNNVRRAYSPPGDNGWTFTFEDGNVLGDAGAGGTVNSYVDQKSILLPDGRRRLFVMKQGALYSFISLDGKTYAPEPGVRLAPRDFTGFTVISLHDPVVVRLPDGRYRMYVAAQLAGSQFRWAIVSATTAKP